MFALTLLVLCWHYGLTFARPSEMLRRVDGVPSFVLDYGMYILQALWAHFLTTDIAPIVYLDTGEAYFPSDIGSQLANTQPEVNYSVISNAPNPLTLDNVDALNGFGSGGSDVYLTTTVDVTKAPEPKWLEGVVPDSSGKTNSAITAAIIVNDHGSGAVDAFYMYFYAYNQGNTVLGQELGDHIGDWEHNMIRFKDGVPQHVWYSQHSFGEAFTYRATEKVGKRPVSYSAKGSHANYAIPGKHDHTIPGLNLPDGLIVDHTSKGISWDPTLSSYFYNFHASDSSFESINNSPVAAMNYKGRWGDDQYPDNDKRQKDFFSFKKYVAGPTGPGDKQLNRTKVCPDSDTPCILRDILVPRME
jgi:hypothetical protein